MAEPAEVIQLFPNKSSKMPERFDAHDSELLLRWAKANRFKYEELVYAVGVVRDWAASRARAPLKRDWVRTVENAMRTGWALRGYREQRKRSGSSKPEREITEERIQRHLAMLRQQQ